MNILQVTQEFPPNVVGGVGYHSYNLARQFSNLGHEVTILTTDQGGSKDEVTNFDFSGIEIRRLSPPTMVTPRPIFDWMARRYLRAADLSDFDLIHLHEFVNLNDIDIDVPTILKVHYNLCRGREFTSVGIQTPVIRQAAGLATQNLIAPYERRLERKSLETTDGRVYISDLTRQVYQNQYNHQESDATHRVVPNGIDFERFTICGPAAPGEYFLAVTGSQFRKGYDVLLDVFERNPELRLKLAGSLKGESPPPHENIDVLGHVGQTELASLYRGATALIHPARYEPFGNVILESLASGTPVIVSDETHCGAVGVLDDDVHLAVDPESPESVVNALYQLRDCARIGPQKCRNSVREFTWSTVARQTLDFANERS